MILEGKVEVEQGRYRFFHGLMLSLKQLSMLSVAGFSLASDLLQVKQSSCNHSDRNESFQ